MKCFIFPNHKLFGEALISCFYNICIKYAYMYIYGGCTTKSIMTNINVYLRAPNEPQMSLKCPSHVPLGFPLPAQNDISWHFFAFPGIYGISWNSLAFPGISWYFLSAFPSPPKMSLKCPGNVPQMSRKCLSNVSRLSAPRPKITFPGISSHFLEFGAFPGISCHFLAFP